MDSITPELVKRAYEITKMQPVTGIWGWEGWDDGLLAAPGCGCPISTVCVAMEQGHPSNVITPRQYAARKLDLSISYIDGFVRGVDDPARNTPSRYSRKDFRRGFADGVAVRQMMIEEGLSVERHPNWALTESLKPEA